MKKHNTLKVVLITMIVFMLLSWILPAAYFQSSYVDQGRVQMGIFDLFSYPVTAMSYFGYIALFVIVVGGFYGVLGKTNAYRTLLDKMVKTFKGKEKIVLSVIMILLAVITSICGLQIGLIFFFPLLISLILLMGYDKITAALVTVGGTMVGMAGTTFAYSTVSIINSVFALDMTSEVISKIVILVIGLILLIFNVLKYSSNSGKKKVKKAKVKAKEEDVKTTKTSKSTKSTKTSKTAKTTKAAVKEEEKIVVENKEEEEFIPVAAKGKKRKVWPLVTILSIIFIVMILSFVSWSGAFELTIFDDATSAVTEFKVFDFAIFGKLLGTVNSFGNWTVAELITIIFLASFILALIYKVSFDEYVDGFISGAKRAVGPAVIIILIYACLVITTYHPFQLVIYKAILGLTKGFNVFTTSLTAILAALFNVEPAYAFQSVLPYLASIVTEKSDYPLIAVIFQSLYGLVMLAAPTSVVLMSVLSYLKISYKEWLKNIWKLLLELLVILVVIFTILVLI